MFARSPHSVFAGLLHARGLMTLSPYSTAGEADRDMFFGREALLRELMIASKRQHLIVGPRRVGKTSLLKRLETQLREADPESHLATISLLNVRDLRLIERLQRLYRHTGRRLLPVKG